MAGSYNKALVIGYLGRDPETRYTPSGEAVSNFSVACTESWTDKDGQKQERTTWFGCAAFGKLAETCSQYLHKGSYCYLEGTLSLREYTDRDGVRRSSLDLRVREMRMLDKAGAPDPAPEGERSRLPAAGSAGAGAAEDVADNPF